MKPFVYRCFVNCPGGGRGQGGLPYGKVGDSRLLVKDGAYFCKALVKRRVIVDDS